MLTSRTHSSLAPVAPEMTSREPAEDLDPVVGIAEVDLLEVLRAERLLLDGLRGVAGHVDPLVGQRERRAADHKMLAGAQARTATTPCRGSRSGCGPGASELTSSRWPSQTISACCRETCWSQGTAHWPAERPKTTVCPSGRVRRQRCCASSPWAIRSAMGGAGDQGSGFRVMRAACGLAFDADPGFCTSSAVPWHSVCGRFALGEGLPRAFRRRSSTSPPLRAASSR